MLVADAFCFVFTWFALVAQSETLERVDVSAAAASDEARRSAATHGLDPDTLFAPFLLNSSFTCAGNPVAEVSMDGQRQCLSLCAGMNVGRSNDDGNMGCNFAVRDSLPFGTAHANESSGVVMCRLFRRCAHLQLTGQTATRRNSNHAIVGTTKVDVHKFNWFAFTGAQFGTTAASQIDFGVVYYHALVAAQQRSADAFNYFRLTALLIRRMERMSFSGRPFAHNAPVAATIGGTTSESGGIGGPLDFTTKFRTYTNLGVLIQGLSDPDTKTASQLYEYVWKSLPGSRGAHYLCGALSLDPQAIPGISRDEHRHACYDAGLLPRPPPDDFEPLMQPPGHSPNSLDNDNEISNASYLSYASHQTFPVKSFSSREHRETFAPPLFRYLWNKTPEVLRTRAVAQPIRVPAGAAFNPSVIPFPESSKSLQGVRQYLSDTHSTAALPGARLYLATVRQGRHQCKWPADAWVNFSQAPSTTTDEASDLEGRTTEKKSGTLEYDVRTSVLILDADFQVLEQLPLFAHRQPRQDLHNVDGHSPGSNWTLFPPAEDASLFWDEESDTLWLRFNFLQIFLEPTRYRHLFGSNMAPLHFSLSAACPNIVPTLVDRAVNATMLADFRQDPGPCDFFEGVDFVASSNVSGRDAGGQMVSAASKKACCSACQTAGPETCAVAVWVDAPANECWMKTELQSQGGGYRTGLRPTRWACSPSSNKAVGHSNSMNKSSALCTPHLQAYFDYDEAVVLGTNGRNNPLFRRHSAPKVNLGDPHASIFNSSAPSSDRIAHRKVPSATEAPQSFYALEWLYPAVTKRVDLGTGTVDSPHIAAPPAQRLSRALPDDFRALHGGSSRLVFLPPETFSDGQSVHPELTSSLSLGAGEFLGIGHLHRGGVNTSLARWGHHYNHFFFTVHAQTGALLRISTEFCFAALAQRLTKQSNVCEVIQFASTLSLEDSGTNAASSNRHEYTLLPSPSAQILVSYGVNDCEAAILKLDLWTEVLPLLKPLDNTHVAKPLQPQQSILHRQASARATIALSTLLPKLRVQLRGKAIIPPSQAFEEYFRNASAWSDCARKICMHHGGVFANPLNSAGDSTKRDQNATMKCVEDLFERETDWNHLSPSLGAMLLQASVDPQDTLVTPPVNGDGARSDNVAWLDVLGLNPGTPGLVANQWMPRALVFLGSLFESALSQAMYWACQSTETSPLEHRSGRAQHLLCLQTAKCTLEQDNENFAMSTGQFPHYWLPEDERDSAAGLVVLVRTTLFGEDDFRAALVHVVSSYPRAIVVVIAESGPETITRQVSEWAVSAVLTVPEDSRKPQQCDFIPSRGQPFGVSDGSVASSHTAVVGLVVCSCDQELAQRSGDPRVVVKAATAEGLLDSSSRIRLL